MTDKPKNKGGRPRTETGADARPLGARIPDYLHDRLAAHVVQTSRTKAAVVVAALSAYLDTWEAE